MPRLLLLLLLAAQAFLAFRFGDTDRPLIGDEVYYVHKARYFVEHHGFEPASANDLEVERGRRWGESDWRPQGYPLFIAICAGGDFHAASLRFRVASVQFVLLAAVLFMGFLVVERYLSMPFRVVAALLFGIAPWPFEYVTVAISDSLNAALTMAGALILWRGRTVPRVLAGSLLLMSTMLLRPEMVAIAPLVIAVALALHGPERWLPRAAAALIAVVLVMGSQLAYRRAFTGAWTGTLFGRQLIRDRGAFDWAGTWYGTEHQAYDFVYGLTNGNLPLRLPDRAFGDAEERRLIESAVESVRRTGVVSRETDQVFSRVARKRTSEHPLSAGAGPRIWHAIHLWANLETNTQLLNALANVPAVLRRAILAVLLAVKGGLCILFVVALVRLRQLDRELRMLVLIMATIVVVRTLLMGIALNWMAHRFVLACWPPLLVCAAAALSAIDLRRHRRILG